MKRILALSLLIAGVTSAQEKTAIQTSGEEVLVDVVVRDKKGHSVTNLDQQAFTVLDDGVPRQISSFRLVKGTEAVSAASNGTTTTQKLDPIKQLRLVTLIFDRLNQGERTATRQAALELLKTDFPPNVYMAVFALGNELQAVQGFTNQRDLLTRAVEKVTGQPSSNFTADNDQMRIEAEQALGPNTSGAQNSITRLAQMPTGTKGEVMSAIFARSMIEMVSFNERSETAYAGRSTIWALLAAVRGQSELPGRKALIYFSEGFAIPQGAEDEFKAVISTANKNNLSFYPIDAHGLTSMTSTGSVSTGLNQKSKEGLSAAAASSAQSTNFGLQTKNALGQGGGPVGPVIQAKTEIALSADTAINANRANIQDTLAILADETGGFLTANTNDFSAPLRRVMEEIDTYYEITYTPHIDQYDGKFRHIAVKVANNDLTVQSRAGYFALPPDMLRTTGLNAYEVPLLRTLSDMRTNPALPFESGGMHFRGDSGMETCGVLIDMALSNLTFREERGKNMLTGGFAYLALIKDVKGAVVKKLHGEMPLEVSREQALSVRQGRFTDVEYVDVAPGYYTIEAAVLDRESGQTNARRSAMFVPKHGDGLAMSSVALIGKWRPKEPDAAPDDPFVVGDKTVTPSLLPKINKSVSTSLPFYVIVYPSTHSSAKPEMFIEFNREGRVKRVAAIAMEAPDSQGRIQYLANAPIEQFDPGYYAVHFLVRQGAEIAEENFAINLEP